MNIIIKYFLIIFFLNFTLVHLSTTEQNSKLTEIEDEAQNKKFKQMLLNYEEKMKNQKPVEYQPGYLEYKQYIVGEIMRRAGK